MEFYLVDTANCILDLMIAKRMSSHQCARRRFQILIWKGPHYGFNPGMAEMQLGMPGAQKVGVHKGRMKRVREGREGRFRRGAGGAVGAVSN